MLVAYEFKYRNSIIDLESKTMQKIINNNHVFKISVLDNSEILNEETILGLHAVFSGKYITNILIIRINVIDYGICIELS